MRPFVVAGIQLDVGRGDETERAARTIRGILRRFPYIQLVLLSELAATGHEPEDAQPLPGPAEERFCALAQELGIWLVPGSIYERVGEHVYNTTPVIDPAGTVVGRYRKMFLFEPYEPRVTPGERPLVFDVPGV
ncbi:MAG: carbon-nitrogen hydrolase family protein, partial [Planctomycetota bacterium]